MPSRSTNSSNFSDMHFSETPLSFESAPVTQNILPPTLKQRSCLPFHILGRTGKPKAVFSQLFDVHLGL